LVSLPRLPHKPQRGFAFAAGALAVARFVDGDLFAVLALAMRNAL
jgi:hypothetical protein